MKCAICLSIGIGPIESAVTTVDGDAVCAGHVKVRTYNTSLADAIREALNDINAKRLGMQTRWS